MEFEPTHILAHSDGLERVHVSTVSYTTLIRLSFRTLERGNYSSILWQQMETHHGFINYVLRWTSITPTDVFLAAFLTILWTTLRLTLTNYIFRPFSHWEGFSREERGKVPEAMWKLLFYCFTWSLSLNALVFSGRHSYFEDPLSCWTGWHSRLVMPTDIYVIYIIQFSFYIHSFYGTLYLDLWRKDSPLMLAHHCLTLMLIGFSFATRGHATGALVLLLHDLSDILLEFTKMNVYLKNFGGTFGKICDVLSAIGFISFAVNWFVCRLYWFPLKVLYTSLYGGLLSVPTEYTPIIYIFNVMLWLLFAMNVYWFHFILVALYKVAKGQMVNDTREYDSDGNLLSSNKSGGSTKSSERKHVSNGVAAGRGNLRKRGHK